MKASSRGDRDSASSLQANSFNAASARQAKPVAFVRYVNQKTQTVTCTELVNIMYEKITSVRIVQQYVQNHSLAHEIYYVECRRDDSTLPISWKYLKKAFKKKGQAKSSHNARNDESQIGSGHTQNYTSSDNVVTGSGGSNNTTVVLGKPLFFEEAKMEYDIYKFFDQRTNECFSEIVKRLLAFIEKAYQVKVRKMIAKFIINQASEIIFMGCYKLFVELVKEGTQAQFVHAIHHSLTRYTIPSRETPFAHSPQPYLPVHHPLANARKTSLLLRTGSYQFEEVNTELRQNQDSSTKTYFPVFVEMTKIYKKQQFKSIKIKYVSQSLHSLQAACTSTQSPPLPERHPPAAWLNGQRPCNETRTSRRRPDDRFCGGGGSLLLLL